MILHTNSDYDFEVYKGKPDSTQFDICDHGAYLVSVVASPTEEEIEEFRQDKIRLRAVAIKNITWLTLELAEEAVIDAPFSLHLAKNLSDKNLLKEKLKTLRIALVDSVTGKAAIQLKYYLDSEFIEELSKIILSCYNQPFERTSYFDLIEDICNNFSPEDIFRDSEIEYCSYETPDKQLSMFDDTESVTNEDESNFESTDSSDYDELIDENERYIFYYRMLEGNIIRKDKTTGKYVVFCKGNRRAIIYGDKFYWYKSEAILSDNYICRCNLDGSQIETIDVLDNSKERGMVAGGFSRQVSLDEVVNMHIDNNSLIVVVDRRYYHGTGRGFKYFLEFKTPETSCPIFHIYEEELLKDSDDGFFYPRDFKNTKDILKEADKIIPNKLKVIKNVLNYRKGEEELEIFEKTYFEAFMMDLESRGFSKRLIKKWKSKYFK